MLSLLFSALLASGTDVVRHEAHLLTMGPGEHVYTAAGHAALMIVDLGADGRVRGTRVYNYGDADWDDPNFAWKVLRKELSFFVSVTNSLNEVVNEYGLRQGREIFRQKLALTDEQAALLSSRLEHDAKPENKRYPYHYAKAICTTKIRDQLDRVLDGELRRQLDQPDAADGSRFAGAENVRTYRDAQHLSLRGHPLAELAADFFFGRHHDEPITAYAAMALPETLRAVLTHVQVGPPGAKVPLASAPSMVTQAEEPEAPARYGVGSYGFIGFWLVFILTASVLAAQATGERKTTIQASVLVAFGFVFGLASAASLLLSHLSGFSEVSHNENVLLFPPLDLLFVAAGIVALGRKHLALGKAVPWLRAYVFVRSLVLAGVVILRIVSGVSQEPLSWFLLSVVMNGVLIHWVSRGRSSASRVY